MSAQVYSSMAAGWLMLLAGCAAASDAPPAGSAPPQEAAATANAVWPQASDLGTDPEVRYGVLPNKMRYAIKKNATPPGEASLRLRIDAGSLHEREDQRGVAHFLEHMVLNGTTNVPEGEFIRRLERAGLKFGPDTNASTDFQQTVYKLDLPETDAATVDTALYLLREVADEALLDAAAIDAERGIILSEERTRATPQYRIVVDELDYLLKDQLLPDRLPIGTTEVITRAPRERFVEYYERYYRPERATLIAVGDFDVDEMERKIRAQFGSWQGQGTAGPEPGLGNIADRELETRVFVEPGGPNRVSLSWLRPVDLRPDSRTVRKDSLVKARGLRVLSRRLERIAATTSPPPFIGAAAVAANQADSAEIIQVIAVAQPGQWQKALATIEQEQRRLAQHGVTKAELDREISEVRAALAAAAAGAATRPTSALAEDFVRAVNEEDVITTPADDLALFDESVAGLTSQQVDEALRTAFSGEGPLLYMTTPTPIEGGEAALLAGYQGSRAQNVAAPAAQQALTWPYSTFGPAGEVAERRQLAELGATAIRFRNGVRLTVKPTNFRDDEILVSVRFGDGRLDLPADRPSPEWALSAGAFTAGGLDKIGFEDMQQVLASKVYGADIGFLDDAFVLQGKTRPEDLAVQMQVLAAYVAHPAWRPTGWDRLRSLSGTIHDQLEATPAGVFGRDHEALLRSGDRRWAMPLRQEMASSTIDQARSVLAGPLGSEPIEVVIVGDITVAEAIRQTAATFGALPARNAAAAPATALRFPAGTREPVRRTHKGRADQSLAFIAWPTQGFYPDLKQARALNLLAQVFQLRLLDEIREKQGTTYSPQASHDPSEVFEGYGYLAARIEAPPEKLAGFLTDAMKIARSLREAPVSADELQRARRPLVENIQRGRNGNAWWLTNLADVQEDPRVAQKIGSQVGDYQNISAAELRRAAQRFLIDDKAWKMVVVPEAK